MSNDIEKDVKQRKERVQLSTKRLLSDLQSFLPTDGSFKQVPVGVLAKRYKVHRNTVTNHLRELREAGSIEVYTYGKHGRIYTEVRLIEKQTGSLIIEKSEEKQKWYEPACQNGSQERIVQVNTVCFYRAVEGMNDELKSIVQWVCWRYGEVQANGKREKVPYNALLVDKKASSTNAATWASYTQVCSVQHCHDGIGFVLNRDYTVIDLDHCVVDGMLASWAHVIIQRFHSYTELSPSGTGVHIFVRGTIPKGRRVGSIEMYCVGRYITITGSRLESLPLEIADAQEELDAFYHELMPKPREENFPLDARMAPCSENEVLKKAKAAVYKYDRFNRLWKGDISLYIDDSHPEGDRHKADAALCRYLAYWCDGDATMIDSLFRQSGLMRDKWDEYRGHLTYGQMTIRYVLSHSIERV